MKLTPEVFASLLDVPVAALPDLICQKIEEYGFRYEPIDKANRDEVILRILQRIESGELSRVGEHRKDVWEKGWEENLEAFSTKGFALESLVPRFIRDEPILRFQQDYVRALDPMFEFCFHDIVRRWLFLTFMSEARAVYEFGSGSSYNLVAISELAPELKLVGLDWAESAVKLANLIGKSHSINLTGRRFDLFHPDDSLEIGPEDAALTVCALEQVGWKHDEFLQFLLKKKPRICVHMEPLVELYDPNNLVDYLALRFHRQREYLSGFLPSLQQLELDGVVKILKMQRLNFGSLYHEGYSLVVWEPL
jgi:hypothetical protein